ncbi:MAG: glycosyltransferase [Sphingomicrobium sp.]
MRRRRAVAPRDRGQDCRIGAGRRGALARSARAPGDARRGHARRCLSVAFADRARRRHRGHPGGAEEAMAVGRPVITTRHGGIPELVDDGVSGLLADEGDAARIASAIERLADDPALRSRLVIVARARVEQDFDLARIGGRLRGRYRSLAARHRAHPRAAAAATALAG